MDGIENGLADEEDGVYAVSSKRRRSQSIGARPFLSLTAYESDGARQKQLGDKDKKINAMREKLPDCHNGKNEFEIVANNTVGRVGDSMVELKRNRIAHQEIVTTQQNQASEFKEHAEKIINQCEDPSRDLAHRRNAFPQKFTQINSGDATRKREFCVLNNDKMAW